MIPHFEHLKPREVISIAEAWNKNPGSFTVREKLDGCSFTMGFDNQGFYTRSNGPRKNYTSDQYKRLFYMKGHYELHSRLNSGMWTFNQLTRVIPNSLALERSFDESPFIELVGEGLPWHDYNLIEYDSDVINPATFVILKLKWENGEDANPGLLGDLANTVDRICLNINVRPCPHIGIEDFSFFPEYISSIKKIYSGHLRLINKVARIPSDKIRQAELRKEIQDIAYELKLAMHSHLPGSMYGDTIEGAVITHPEFRPFKIVDQTGFTQRKDREWFYINAARAVYRAVKRELKNPRKDIGDLLTHFENQLIDIQEQYETNGRNKTVTIGSKIRETEEQFRVLFGIIAEARIAYSRGQDRYYYDEIFYF